jgi:hypothetical protein
MQVARRGGLVNDLPSVSADEIEKYRKLRESMRFFGTEHTTIDAPPTALISDNNRSLEDLIFGDGTATATTNISTSRSVRRHSLVRGSARFGTTGTIGMTERRRRVQERAAQRAGRRGGVRRGGLGALEDLRRRRQQSVADRRERNRAAIRARGGRPSTYKRPPTEEEIYADLVAGGQQQRQRTRDQEVISKADAIAKKHLARLDPTPAPGFVGREPMFALPARQTHPIFTGPEGFSSSLDLSRAGNLDRLQAPTRSLLGGPEEWTPGLDLRTPTGENLVGVMPGEFVVNSEATKKYLSVLEAINDKKLPKFANGGPVTPNMHSPGGGNGFNLFGDIPETLKDAGNVFLKAATQLSDFITKVENLTIPEEITIGGTFAPLTVNFTGETALADAVAKQIAPMVEARIADAVNKAVDPLTGETMIQWQFSHSAYEH